MMKEAFLPTLDLQESVYRKCYEILRWVQLMKLNSIEGPSAVESKSVISLVHV